jgi:4-amino-4-deoxy-L-arabinose transferase-like glycosyltransferase
METSGRRRDAIILGAILVLALLLRLGFWFGVVGFDSDGWGDEPDYHRLAASVAAGEGLTSPLGEPTAARPPLYPIILGGVYRVFGDDPDVARAFQVLLGIVAVWLTYILARRLATPGGALLAALLAATNPALIYMSALIMSENIYILAILGVLLLLVRDARHVQRPATVSRYALVGALSGGAYLARPQMLFFAAFVGAAVLWTRALSWRGRLARVLVLAVAAAVVVAPWIVRNHEHFSAFLPSTTHGGITFYESNNELIPTNPDFKGIVVIPRKTVPGWDELKDLPEVEYNRRAFSMGFEFLRTHPGLSARMAWWKFLRFWRFDAGIEVPDRFLAKLPGGPGGGAATFVRTVDLGAVYWWVIIPLFVVGLLASWKARRRYVLLYGVVVAHTVVALIFHGSIRARSPVEPVIVILAAVAVGWLRSVLRARTRVAQ